MLGVCGGIAAYKVIQVARDLTLLGASVDVILTEAAQEFVTPLSFEGVTGRTPLTHLFSAEGAARHVTLGREADCVCIAPATADFISRAAQGRADDLLTTVLLATEAPVVLAPSMNDRMYAHPQTQANLDHLEASLHYHRVGPVAGKLAVGEGRGPGRLIEPPSIIEAVGRALHKDSPLSGANVLVTAGPTREPVDPVRYLGNRSSGKMGYALGQAAWRRGAEVTIVSGPTVIEPPHGPRVIRVETAIQMNEAVRDEVGGADLVIHSAAVSDYRPATSAASKIKRTDTGNALTLDLVENPDIAIESKRLMKDGALSVGFALETDDLIERARDKMARKGFDLIVANGVEPGSGFETDTNRATILAHGEDPVELPLLSKAVLADRILDEVEARLNTAAPAG